MNIKVNGKETVLNNQATVTDLAQQLQLPEKGVAIAVNNKMVPRTEWKSFVIHENDSLVVIKAACGG